MCRQKRADLCRVWLSPSLWRNTSISVSSDENLLQLWLLWLLSLLSHVSLSSVQWLRPVIMCLLEASTILKLRRKYQPMKGEKKSALIHIQKAYYKRLKPEDDCRKYLWLQRSYPFSKMSLRKYREEALHLTSLFSMSLERLNAAEEKAAYSSHEEKCTRRENRETEIQ